MSLVTTKTGSRRDITTDQPTESHTTTPSPHREHSMSHAEYIRDYRRAVRAMMEGDPEPLKAHLNHPRNRVTSGSLTLPSRTHPTPTAVASEVHEAHTIEEARLSFMGTVSAVRELISSLARLVSSKQGIE